MAYSILVVDDESLTLRTINRALSEEGFDVFVAIDGEKALEVFREEKPDLVLVDIVLLGIAGGIYIVPLYALIQTRCDKAWQSRVIAANNIVNAAFMVLSSLLSIALLKAGCSIAQLFLFTALFTMAVVGYLCAREPEFWRRAILWMMGKARV